MLHLPRFVLAGLRGGSGKTIISLGLARYIKDQNFSIKPYKKGPDYIDAVWLGRAAGSTTTNLDPFLMSSDTIQSLFQQQSQGYDLSIVEGNRGLFDGKDLDGSCSTANLAQQIASPVILILDCTKMTRTVVPVVLGCQHFEPGLQLAGVILNQTAGQRHRSILRQCLERYTDLPVLGALPKLKKTPIPERQMGLISDREFKAEQVLQELAQVVGDNLDVDRIQNIALEAGSWRATESRVWPDLNPAAPEVNIAVVRDTSLWFYYPENLEALRRCGAELKLVSLLEEDPWPEIHGLYLGGGFPETQAGLLAANQSIKDRVLEYVRRGLPIYAECGGLMYLCSTLTVGGESYSMVGVFAANAELCSRPQGHGYTRSLVVAENPFHPVGLEFSGHEFHYSRCCAFSGWHDRSCLQMLRGQGLGQSQDGLSFRNTLAAYTHLHALSVPSWARNFVWAAREFKKSQAQGLDYCPDLAARQQH